MEVAEKLVHWGSLSSEETTLSGLVWKELGVKQGSVLSPVLFLIVMNPLLKQLQESSLGLSINNFYADGSCMLMTSGR